MYSKRIAGRRTLVSLSLLLSGFVLLVPAALAQLPGPIAAPPREAVPGAPLDEEEQPAPQLEAYHRPLRTGQFEWQIIGLHEDFAPSEHAVPSCRKIGDIVYLRGTAEVRSGSVTNARPLGHLPRACRGKIRSHAGTFFPGPLKISINAYQGVLTVHAWDFGAPEWHRNKIVFDGIYFFTD